MALRYLDINPISTIQGGNYNKIILAFPGETEDYRFVEKQIDTYYNGKFQNSLTCNTCSSGYTYAGFFKGLFIYNSNLKIFTSLFLLILATSSILFKITPISIGPTIRFTP